MKTINVFGVLLLLVLNLNAQFYLSGNITETLNLSDTVIVVGNVNVIDQGALIFQSGSKVLVDGYFTITISGTGKISALGTLNDSIYFTVTDTTGFSNLASTDGSWSGIEIIDQNLSADSSIFEYCSFSFAKGFTSISIYNGGALNFYNAENTRISNCLFDHNYSDGKGGGASLIYTNLLEKCTFKNNLSGGSGGGLYIYTGIVDSCNFVNNKADAGGGIYCFAGLVSGCSFQNNTAELHGGGIYFLSGILENSIIDNNHAEIGGGGCYANGYCQLLNLHFINNSAGDGGGLASYPFFTDIVLVSGCLFENNNAESGGGASALFGNTEFSDCNFTGNIASSFGGGLNVTNCPIYNCSFSGNVTSLDGGGIYAEECDISNCSFSNNQAFLGGGIAARTSTIIKCLIQENTSSVGGGGISSGDFCFVDSCDINNNVAEDYGGGIYASNEQVYRNCTISNNSSLKDGGGVYISLDGPIFENCIISSNYSAEDGGGIVFKDGGIITNCLIINNTASLKGGGIYAQGNFNINGKVTNCSICFNEVSDTTNNGGGIYSSNEGDFVNNVIWGNNSQIFVQGSNVNFSYCAVQEIQTVVWGGASITEIIDLTPENMGISGPNFTSPVEDDFSLLNASILINRGNPDTSGLHLPDYDLAGLPRINKDTVDMGAYENQLSVGYQNTIIPNFLLFPNPASKNIYGVSQSPVIEIMVYDINGYKLIIDFPNNKNFMLNIEFLTEGIYFTRIKYQGGKTIIRKFVKIL